MKSLRERILDSDLHRSNHHHQKPTIIIIILEGILLFNEGNPLKDLLHLKIFLSVPYSLAKMRREARVGYVTHSATDPDPDPDPNRNHDGGDGAGDYKGDGQHKGTHVYEIDHGHDHDHDHDHDYDDKDKERGLDFWKDPPGYFDDVVWPTYLRLHSYLFRHSLDHHPHHHPHHHDGDGDGQDHDHELVDRDIDLDQSHPSFDEDVLRREGIHLHSLPIIPHRKEEEKNHHHHHDDDDDDGGGDDGDDDDSFLESLEWSLDLILQTPLPLSLSLPTSST